MVLHYIIYGRSINIGCSNQTSFRHLQPPNRLFTNIILNLIPYSNRVSAYYSIATMWGVFQRAAACGCVRRGRRGGGAAGGGGRLTCAGRADRGRAPRRRSASGARAGNEPPSHYTVSTYYIFSTNEVVFHLVAVKINYMTTTKQFFFQKLMIFNGVLYRSLRYEYQVLTVFHDMHNFTQILNM